MSPKYLLSLLLLPVLALGQKVNPNQIQPGTNGYVLTTVAGVAAWAAAVGGCGAVVGDTTSTTCGTGNRTGDTASVPANIQVFGYNNLATNSGQNIVALGSTNGASNASSNAVLIGNGVSTGTGIFDFIAIGDGSLAGNTAHQDVVAIGVQAGLNNGYVSTVDIGTGVGANSTSSGQTDFIAIGDGSGASDISTFGDLISIGDGAGDNIASGSADVISIGNGAGSGAGHTISNANEVVAIGLSSGSTNASTTGESDVVAIGDSNVLNNEGSSVVGIGVGNLTGNATCSGVGNTGNELIAIGDTVLAANSTGSENVAIGHLTGSNGFSSCSSLGNANKTGSNNTWIGSRAGPNTTSQLSNTIALGYQAYNTASNQTTIGNSSITSLVLYGCPTGQSALADGSGTCYVPGAGGSGGTNVSVNGGSTLTAANLNGTTPAAGASNINVAWQLSGSNVSAEVPYASSSAFGVVKPDNSTITISSGVISAIGAGVSSITGDGTIITNSASTGAVTLALAGTSGGIPYFSSSSGWASSALLTAHALLVGGGAATAPSAISADTTTTHALFATATNPAFRAIASGDLPSFGSAAAGIVPASGGGTANFLRADGSWSAPVGSVTGSGTTGYLPLWSSSSALGSSVCDQGITTANTVTCSPSAGFAVAGSGAGKISPTPTTIASLPSASSVPAGTMIVISDATSFTVGTCTGGGSDYMIAISSGSTWSCH